MASRDIQFTGTRHGGDGRRGGGHGRRFYRTALVLAILLAPAAADAGSSESRLTVGATLLARATLVRQQSAAFLEVSAADVARGFVEVPRAAQLAISSTSPLGFALELAPRSRLFVALEVVGVGAQVTLPAEGGEITLRGQHGLAQPLELAIRFSLAPGVTPGRYPWPLQYAVRPL